LGNDYDPGRSWQLAEGELVLSHLSDYGVDGELEDGHVASLQEGEGSLSFSVTFQRCEVHHR
jgi:hypothetical protein